MDDDGIHHLPNFPAGIATRLAVARLSLNHAGGGVTHQWRHRGKDAGQRPSASQVGNFVRGSKTREGQNDATKNSKGIITIRNEPRR